MMRKGNSRRNIMLLGVLLLLLAGTPAAASSDQWAKSFEVNGMAELKVDTSDANIRVDTWDRNTIDTKITTRGWKIGDGGINIYDHQSGNAVDLQVKFPRFEFHVFNFRRRRVDIEIHMPREAKLNLHTGDGSIEVRGTRGEITLHTGDGHVELSDVDGAVRASTGDGSVSATGRFDVLDLKTGDGKINAAASSGSRMASAWSLRTGDGSLTLRLPESFSADIDLHTSDGHIELQLPVTVSGRYGTKDVRGKINGGGEMLTLKTGDGSIHLEKM
jgi:DUF4097 and DUF4098 domain-containing protein YvlB